MDNLPQFKLFLDVDGNFNPASPSSDHVAFIPGSLGGTSVPLPQSVQLIAAYVNSTGGIAPPPVLGEVSFSLSETSAFWGVAMNAGSGSSPDYSLGSSSATFMSDHTARVTLLVRDYGGVTKAIAHHNVESSQLSLPEDLNANMLPDNGWHAGGVLVPDDAVFGSNDAESGGGSAGDGITAWEEFRGFMILGQHTRLNPAVKDLFVNTSMVGGAGDATSLGINIHLIDASEMEPSNIINTNFQNLGGGPQPQGHYTQKALRIRDGGFSGTAGGVIIGGNEGDPPSKWTEIQIFTRTLRQISPPTNDQTTVDPIDSDKLRQTIGHEIGHGVGLFHLSNPACPPPAVTVMLADYFVESNGTGANACAWQNIPHGYTPHEMTFFKLR